jgi:hypothetical protein
MRAFMRVIAAGLCGLMLPSFAAAQEATGQITTQIDGKPAVFTIVNQADEALGIDGADAKSAFAPQSDEFSGIVSLALWAIEVTSGTPLMLNLFHRVWGEPTEVDQFFSGFLFYAEGGEEWSWSADLSQPGSTWTLDTYLETDAGVNVTGQFSTTAYYQAADQDEPDLSRSISISGTFDVVLPALETP